MEWPAGLPWNSRPLRPGINGRLALEWVAALPWNGWPEWRGIRNIHGDRKTEKTIARRVSPSFATRRCQLTQPVDFTYSGPKRSALQILAPFIDIGVFFYSIYVIRTSLPPDKLDAGGAVKAYKGLSVAERAFRCFKAVDLKVRPIHHRLEHRVRAHVFLCMLAYYLEWHMRRALSPILFDDDDPLAAEAQRDSVVEPAQRSPSAQQKALSKRTKENLPVHSFRTLLKDLATISKNLVKPRLKSAPSFEKTTLPAVLQRKAFKLLGVKI